MSRLLGVGMERIGYETHFHRPHHPAGRPRQDRHLPRRPGRRGQRLLADPGAARLRAVLRGPAGRGHAEPDRPHLRRLPGGPPHGGHQGPGRACSTSIRRRRPRSSASCSTASSTPPTTRRTSTPWAGRTSSSAPTAPPAERNILGVVAKVGMDVAGKVLKMRHDGHALIKMIGGRRRTSQLGPARRRQPRHQRGAAQGDRGPRPRGRRVRQVLAETLRRRRAGQQRTTSS